MPQRRYDIIQLENGADGMYHSKYQHQHQSDEKYRLVLLWTCCALSSGGTNTWWTT